ncbi:MAG: hypothetical protein WD757_02695 [Actinomycetota bacterium]
MEQHTSGNVGNSFWWPSIRHPHGLVRTNVDDLALEVGPRGRIWTAKDGSHPLFNL